MKTLTTFLAFFAFPFLTFSQAPGIDWQNTIGGTLNDYLTATIKSSDGSYYLGGWGSSNTSGDKTSDGFGGNDYWLVKIDSLGSIIWDKTIGGSGEDIMTDLVATNDDGCLIGGYSSSGISGLKTEVNNGSSDYWIVKLDSNGNIEWQNTIGGNSLDRLISIRNGQNGGYILSGYSNSDISFDKTESNRGFYDYWIVKIDNLGNIEWNKTFGGDFTDDENICIPTSRNSYIIGGKSDSNISGEKTESKIGGSDYWIIEIDSIGNILWQNTIGGTGNELITDIIEYNYGEYILAGVSSSNISGDKTENAYDSNLDFWIVKIDTVGNIVWDKTIGTIGNESQDCSISRLNNSDLIIAGGTDGGISGNKSENSYGGFDYWIVLLDSIGDVIFDKSFGGAQDDFLSDIFVTDNSSFLLSGYSSSTIAGNKTEENVGQEDYWVIKLFDYHNAMSLPEYVPTENLIAWYPFNGNTNDESGNNHHGTITGGVTITSDRFDVANSAYIFDGTSGYITVTTLDTLQYSPITFSAWGIINSYFPTPEPGHKFRSIIGRNTTFIEENGVIGFYADGNVASGAFDNNFLMWRGGGVTGDLPYSNSTPELNTWVHIVYTQSETGEFKWYTNGELTNEGTFTGVQNDFNFFQIGGCNNTGVLSVLWNDKLDDIGVWNRVLNSTEVSQLYGGCTTEYFVDADEDGYGDALSEAIVSCDSIEGYVINNMDCDDTNPASYMGAIEICDGFDNDCDGDIDEGTEPTISISASGPTNICQGESVLLTAEHSGGSLQWKKNSTNIPGATGINYTATSKANYTCVITSDCGVIASNIILVKVAKPPIALISASGPTTFCPGGSVTLSVAVAPGHSYQWFKGATALVGETGITYLATTSGNYKCRVTKNSSGCLKMSAAITVSASCRLENELGLTMYLFPNPTNGNVNIQFSEELQIEATLKVYSLTGSLILQKLIVPYTQSINLDMNQFASGVYFVEIKSEDYSFTDKIIKY